MTYDRRKQHFEISVNCKAALMLAEQGFAVFPVHHIKDDGDCSCGKKDCSSPGKHPLTSNGFKSATTDKEQILEMWKKHPDANVGVATGRASDVLVIDVDPRNGGDETLKALFDEFGEFPETLECGTGGDGQHFYFEMPSLEPGIKLSSKLGAGIDVKHDGGYVIAPPSNHHSGGIYEWGNSAEIAEIPDWLFEKLKARRPANTNYINKKVGGSVSNDNENNTASLSQIKKGCAWVASCFEDSMSLDEPNWYHALSIISRCENGVQEARNFSEPYPLYDPIETDQKTNRSLNETGPITCNYVASNLVNDNKCQSCIYHGKINSPINLGTVSRLMADFVYINDQESFYELRTGAVHTSPGFSKAYAHCGSKMAGTFLSSKAMVKVVSQVYEPKEKQIIKEDDGRLFLNRWQGSDVEPKEGDASVFENHLNYTLPGAYERNMLADGLAHFVQNEGVKINYVFLIIGRQGTGKSYFGQTLSKLLGKNNVCFVETDELHSDYNSWLAHKSLIVVEELMARNRLSLGNKLKPIITQETIRVNEKYEKPYEVANKANFLIFTNHDDPIILDGDDRRYCILESPAYPKEAEYYDQLWQWTDDNLGVILNFLLSRDLSGFNPKQRAPHTDAKDQLLRETEPFEVKELRRLIELSRSPFSCDIVALDDLQGHPPITPLITTHKLAGYLKRIGCKAVGQIRLQGLSRKRLWIVRNVGKWQAASNADIAAEHKSGLP
ncbi:bifunctional DNA primase/polymerase [Emcibacteraceae bacterium]|nr:bifunctional DNA primase/polymerase [Emcibacteraceae bacterium]